MSTTPSIFECDDGTYTVVGGRHHDRPRARTHGFTIVLLNRGGRFNRSATLGELERLGATEVLCVEPGESAYEVESLSRRMPRVRFVLLHKKLTTGETINLTIKESGSNSVMVIWNDVTLVPTSAKPIEKAASRGVLCVVPFARNEKSEIIPTVYAPAFFKNFLRLVAVAPRDDGAPSLFPYDYVGLYNKEKFIGIGGYDPLITNSYWQKADFGFRAFMWGESIVCDPHLRVAYSGLPSPEDTTNDASYARFHAKNLSVRFSGDRAILPASRVLRFAFRSGHGLLRGYRVFADIRAWVEANRYRFRQDARRVTELWEVEQ